MNLMSLVIVILKKNLKVKLIHIISNKEKKTPIQQHGANRCKGS